MNKYIRSLVLDKVAAIYEDPEHKDRIRKRRERMTGLPDEEEGYKPEDPEADRAMADAWMEERRKALEKSLQRGEDDSRFAFNPDQVAERPLPHSQKVQELGFDSETEPLSESERERRDKKIREINLFSTIGEVEGLDGAERQYVDPSDPSASRLHKYFGYYDKETQRWYPTQFSYIMFYMAAHARELGMKDFLDESNPISLDHKSFRRHPYRRQYAKKILQEQYLYPFTTEMEDRILTDFPKIVWAMNQGMHDTTRKTNEGLPYLAPKYDDLGGGHEIRFFPEENAFTVRGPLGSAETIHSQYSEGASDAERITKRVLSKSALYPKLAEAIATLREEIESNVLREIVNQNRELNFMRGQPESKEQVRGAIVQAISELLEDEVRKIVKDSDF